MPLCLLLVITSARLWSIHFPSAQKRSVRYEILLHQDRDLKKCLNYCFPPQDPGMPSSPCHVASISWIITPNASSFPPSMDGQSGAFFPKGNAWGYTASSFRYQVLVYNLWGLVENTCCIGSSRMRACQKSNCETITTALADAYFVGMFPRISSTSMSFCSTGGSDTWGDSSVNRAAQQIV